MTVMAESMNMIQTVTNITAKLFSSNCIMRLSVKAKLQKKTPVGAASSRELKRSRLEAAPTIANTLVLSRSLDISKFIIGATSVKRYNPTPQGCQTEIAFRVPINPG